VVAVIRGTSIREHAIKQFLKDLEGDPTFSADEMAPKLGFEQIDAVLGSRYEF